MGSMKLILDEYMVVFSLSKLSTFDCEFFFNIINNIASFFKYPPFFSP